MNSKVLRPCQSESDKVLSLIYFEIILICLLFSKRGVTCAAHSEFGSKYAWQESSLDFLGDAGMRLGLDALEGTDACTRTSPPSMGRRPNRTPGMVHCHFALCH